MKIKLSKQEWLRVGQSSGWMPRDTMDVSDRDLNPMYTAQDEENALLGKEESQEEVNKSVYNDGFKAGSSRENDASSCPYKSDTRLSNIWWEGFRKGKESKNTIAKTIKIVKTAELSENVVPVEQILGTSPNMPANKLDEYMHAQGYFFFREHYRWGRNLSYQNKNGDKIYLERDDSGKMVWMTQKQFMDQVKKTWVPASQEDQDWFTANLGS